LAELRRDSSGRRNDSFSSLPSLQRYRETGIAAVVVMATVLIMVLTRNLKTLGDRCFFWTYVRLPPLLAD
jgi:hypothetical protein